MKFLKIPLILCFLSSFTYNAFSAPDTPSEEFPETNSSTTTDAPTKQRTLLTVKRIVRVKWLAKKFPEILTVADFLQRYNSLITDDSILNEQIMQRILDYADLGPRARQNAEIRRVLKEVLESPEFKGKNRTLREIGKAVEPKYKFKDKAPISIQRLSELIPQLGYSQNPSHPTHDQEEVETLISLALSGQFISQRELSSALLQIYPGKKFSQNWISTSLIKAGFGWEDLQNALQDIKKTAERATLEEVILNNPEASIGELRKLYAQVPNGKNFSSDGGFYKILNTYTLDLTALRTRGKMRILAVKRWSKIKSTTNHSPSLTAKTKE